MARPTVPARLPLLDALRGIAAVAVMLHHEPLLYAAHGAITRAYLAVDFFYMLSGLVLTLAFEPRFAQTGARHFMLTRVARLWPVMAVGVLLGGVWQYLGHGVQGLGLMLAMGLLIVPRLWGAPGRIYWLDGPEWSVAYELVGNALHSALLWRWGTRALLGFTLACGVVVAGLAVHFGAIAMGDTVATWWAGFFRLGFSYGTGMVIGRLLRAHYRPDERPLAWAAAALPLPLVLFLGGFAPLGEPWLDLAVVLVLFPPLLWWMARVALPEALTPGALWLGRLSYPLYAVHIPVIGIMAQLAHGTSGAAHTAIRLAAPCLAVALAAIIAASPIARGIPLRRKG